MHRSCSSPIFFAAALALAGCASESDAAMPRARSRSERAPAAATAPPAAIQGRAIGEPEPEVSIGTAPRAAIEIAAAGCERADRCGRVGTGGNYEDRVTCIDEVAAAWASELTGDACPRGVDEHELTACVAALRDASCSPRGALGSEELCSPRTVCRAG